MRGLFARIHHAHHGHHHHHGHPHLHALWHAHASRHHGFGGHGGRHGMPGEPGMEGFGAGRKLRSADLQLLIVALLAERPRHGYELIKDIDEHSKGYYAPSPGMIYPALSYLEEVGHAQAETEGAKKRYSLTPEGEVWLADQRAAADALLAQLASMGERMERARQAWSGAGSSDESAQEESGGFFALFKGRRRLTHEFHEAYHAIRDAVRSKVGASAEEQRRVAAVLMRAAEEIRGGANGERA